MVVDEAASLQSAVEHLGDAGGAVGIAGQQHQRRVVADLGAKVDLGHGGHSPGIGRGI